MTTKSIYIARDFSPSPAGRYPADSEFNGERFREELLLPALRENDVVEVNLNDTGGYGSSFLEEAFGGLVRAGFTPEMLRAKLRVISSRATYEMKVWSYIDRASKAAA